MADLNFECSQFAFLIFENILMTQNISRALNNNFGYILLN